MRRAPRRWRAATALTLGVALGLALTQFGATLMRVHGDSMAPTLHDGQYLLVLRPPAAWLASRIGLMPGPLTDGALVAVVEPPGGAGAVRERHAGLARPLLVKRVTAMAGQTVAYEAGERYLDGRPAPEPWLARGRGGHVNTPGVTLRAGQLYVVGDDRSPLASRDSREFGPIPQGSVRGYPLLVVRSGSGPTGMRWPFASLR